MKCTEPPDKFIRSKTFKCFRDHAVIHHFRGFTRATSVVSSGPLQGLHEDHFRGFMRTTSVVSSGPLQGFYEDHFSGFIRTASGVS